MCLGWSNLLILYKKTSNLTRLFVLEYPFRHKKSIAKAEIMRSKQRDRFEKYTPSGGARLPNPIP